MSIEAHFLLLQRGTNDRHKAMKYTSANQSWQFHFVTMSSILLSLFLSRTEKKAFENVCKKHDISNISIQNQTLSFISSKIGRYLCYLLVRSLAYAAGGLRVLFLYGWHKDFYLRHLWAKCRMSLNLDICNKNRKLSG